MTLKIQPKFGRVLIEREKLKSSIIIPDGAAKRNAHCEGVIVALGETAGWTEIPNQGIMQTLKIGDRVVFGRHSGAWLDGTFSMAFHPKTNERGLKDNDDGTLFVCQDADIIAVIINDAQPLEKAA